MDGPFEPSITYNSRELLFPTQLLQYGYTHKFQVQVKELEVLFEPDEEQCYRAIVDPESMESRKLDTGLLQAIAMPKETLVK